MVCLVVGGYSLLCNRLEGAAVVAFVLAGLLSLLFAIVGFLPPRIKYGDAEIDLTRRVAVAVRPIAESLTPRQLDNAVESLGDSRQTDLVTQAVRMAMVSQLQFENHCLHLVLSASQQHGYDFRLSESGREAGLDGVLSRRSEQGEEHYGVIFKRTTGTSALLTKIGREKSLNGQAIRTYIIIYSSEIGLSSIDNFRIPEDARFIYAPATYSGVQAMFDELEGRATDDLLTVIDGRHERPT